MNLYCPKCKMNFTDSFEECVYCGEKLFPRLVDSNEQEADYNQRNIFDMTDDEILKKYQSYRQSIEKQTGKIMSDKEFIDGLKIARKENLVRFADGYINKEKLNENISNNVIFCPYCNSTDTKRITITSKAVHTAFIGIFSMSRNSKNFHCNNCKSDF